MCGRLVEQYAKFPGQVTAKENDLFFIPLKMYRPMYVSTEVEGYGSFLFFMGFMCQGKKMKILC